MLCLWCSGETRIQLTDSTWLIALKCAVVFSLGFAWRALPSSALLDKGRLYCREHISQPVRSSIHVGVRLALRLLVMFLSIGLITVLVWICLNHSGMVAMFKRMHMNTGSCILMCIMAPAMVAQYGVMGIVMGIRRRIPHWASRLIFVVVGADSRVAFASHIRFVPPSCRQCGHSHLSDTDSGYAGVRVRFAHVAAPSGFPCAGH